MVTKIGSEREAAVLQRLIGMIANIVALDSLSHYGIGHFKMDFKSHVGN